MVHPTKSKNPRLGRLSPEEIQALRRRGTLESEQAVVTRWVSTALLVVLLFIAATWNWYTDELRMLMIACGICLFIGLAAGHALGKHQAQNSDHD